jgi:hypothetical protein
MAMTRPGELTVDPGATVTLPPVPVPAEPGPWRRPPRRRSAPGGAFGPERRQRVATLAGKRPLRRRTVEWTSPQRWLRPVGAAATVRRFGRHPWQDLCSALIIVFAVIGLCTVGLVVVGLLFEWARQP